MRRLNIPSVLCVFSIPAFSKGTKAILATTSTRSDIVMPFSIGEPNCPIH